MPKESPIQTSFNGGIFSPLLDGHIDAPRRQTSYSDSKNLIALKQGPLVRRGGTTNIFEALNPGGNTKVNLTTFLFNDEESYILQWSGDVLRFYTDDGVVLDPTATATIVSITNASPPIVTVDDASNFNDSNRYVLTGNVEATSLNNNWFKIKNTVTGGSETTELYDFDNTTAWIKPRDNTTADRTGTAPTTTEATGGGTLGEIYSLTIPYDEDDLFDSDDIFRPDFVQSNDVMYIAHPDFAPRVIARTADNAWTINKLQFNNGPWLQRNKTETTAFATLVSGRVWNVLTSAANVVLRSDTLTAAAGGDANDEGTATESNRLFRTRDRTGLSGNSTWNWGRITKYIDTTNFQITIDDEALNLTTHAANVDWFLGAYSDTTGYPAVTTIHEGRLVFGATSSEPRRVDLSASSGFNSTETDFIPSDAQFDGVATAVEALVGSDVRPDDAISVTIGGGSANPIQWIESLNKGLVVGTLASEGIIRASSNSESLTPGNASYKKSSTAGSASIQPIPIKNALVHVQLARRRLQELIHNFEIDGLQSFDMTELAEHLTRGRIVDMAFQQEPIETLWVVLADGTLLGFTYERNADVLGWHRHVLGGTGVDVKSVAVKPSDDLSRDEVWLAVARTIDGKASPTRTYIEKMERFYESDIIREDIYHQDSGIQYSTTDIAVTSMTAANPIVVTSATHGRSVDDFVYYKGVAGMLDSLGNSMINGRVFKVGTVPTTETMTLKDVATGVVVDGSGYSGAGTGGTLQQAVNIFQGLDFLEDQSVEIYLDGNTTPNQAVTNGEIVLPTDKYGANVSIGLPSDWLFKSHKIEAGSAIGTAQGKQKRLNQVIVRLFATLGFKYGSTEATAIDEAEFANATAIDNHTPLFTGDERLPWPGGWETDGQIVFKGEGPFPVQIQSIMPQINTSDRLG